MVHVLIIEDEALIALDLQWRLEELGVTSTDIADTEAAAVSAAFGHRPDLITSDVTLRTGTGPQAVRAIQASLGPVPVIYVTANPEACDSLAPNDRVLRKPLSEGAFARTFEEVRAASA